MRDGGTSHGFTFRLGPQGLLRYGALQLFVYAVLPDHDGKSLIDAPAGATLPAWTPLGQPLHDCNITDIASLKRCVAQASQFDQLSLRQDLTCTSIGES